MLARFVALVDDGMDDHGVPVLSRNPALPVITCGKTEDFRAILGDLLMGRVKVGTGKPVRAVAALSTGRHAEAVDPLREFGYAGSHLGVRGAQAGHLLLEGGCRCRSPWRALWASRAGDPLRGPVLGGAGVGIAGTQLKIITIPAGKGGLGL